jgi:hypothetical protein
MYVADQSITSSAGLAMTLLQLHAHQQTPTVSS